MCNAVVAMVGLWQVVLESINWLRGANSFVIMTSMRDECTHLVTGMLFTTFRISRQVFGFNASPTFCQYVIVPLTLLSEIYFDTGGGFRDSCPSKKNLTVVTPPSVWMAKNDWAIRKRVISIYSRPPQRTSIFWSCHKRKGLGHFQFPNFSTATRQILDQRTQLLSFLQKPTYTRSGQKAPRSLLTNSSQNDHVT